MRNWFTDSILLGFVVLVSLSGSIAQTPVESESRVARAMPDLSGVWSRLIILGPGGAIADDSAGTPFLGFSKQDAPLQPWAREVYRANRDGVANLGSKGRDELDPSNSCFPPGPTRIFTDPRPFEIRQIPDVVYILAQEDHWVRRIYMDGKGRAEGYPITWMGYSIGRWDRDILVVDTIDVHDKTWIDTLGTPHSEALHLEERFRRLNHTTLEIEFTFDDPKAYTKPWKAEKIYQLQPPGSETKEDVICEQYRQPGLRKDGFEFIKK